MLTVRQLKHWFYFDIISVRLETPIILFTGIKLQLDQYFRIQIFAIVLLLLSHMMTPLNLVQSINLCEVRGSSRVTILFSKCPGHNYFAKKLSRTTISDPVRSVVPDI